MKLKIILPIAVIILTAGVAYIIINSKPEPERAEPAQLSPPVEFIVAKPEPVNLTVESQGTVMPRTQTTLMAEVSGRILSVSPKFEPGGFFTQGETLLTIDDADLRAALAIEEANMAQAEYSLAQELALAEQAQIDWKELGEGDPTALALREPQIKQAEAMLASAQARVDRAHRDLERSVVKVPYDCLIDEKLVDLGAFVSGTPGTSLARIFATDRAEVRLPLSQDELALIDLPLAFGDADDGPGPGVILTARMAGKTYAWQGHIIRSEASIDPRNRVIYVVAAVDDPYDRDSSEPRRPPLRVGLFVEAEIQGQALAQAVVVPRYALREGDVVLVASDQDTLLRKPVSVLQANDERAILTDGLAEGDRVIISPMEYAVAGMQLTPVESLTRSSDDS